MEFQTKALYNLLKFNFLVDPSIKCERWQVEDLESIKTEKLFEKLAALGIAIDKKHFILYAENFDSPEDLTDCLMGDEETIIHRDQIYLVIFELWRRLLAEKPSLSIFCDELDKLMHLYDKKEPKTEEQLQDTLASLQDILEEHVDDDKDPKAIMNLISSHLAHDFESFLYDYISDHIENGSNFYATELIEGFYPYLKNLRWFDFLRMKIVTKNDVILANDILKSLLIKLKEKADVDLQIEILKSMVERGDPELFLDLSIYTLKVITTEGDFLEFLEILADFYRRLDMDQNDKIIQNIIDKRAKIHVHAKLKEDKDFAVILNLMNKPLKLENLNNRKK